MVNEIKKTLGGLSNPWHSGHSGQFQPATPARGRERQTPSLPPEPIPEPIPEPTDGGGAPPSVLERIRAIQSLRSAPAADQETPPPVPKGTIAERIAAIRNRQALQQTASTPPPAPVVQQTPPPPPRPLAAPAPAKRVELKRELQEPEQEWMEHVHNERNLTAGVGPGKPASSPPRREAPPMARPAATDPVQKSPQPPPPRPPHHPTHTPPPP
ncbi:MAG: hypothetical protein HQM02_02595, partial [Magnetococcales bacterium]|nr:hypothetical protein [Magnetococcales bacterium]